MNRVDSTQRLPHLTAIDTNMWPGVGSVPPVAPSSFRARRAEARFARAAQRAQLLLSSEEPDLVIEHELLFSRIAASGWIGLAESYLAGEWDAAPPQKLARVLRALLAVGYRPKTARLTAETVHTAPGALPASLVAHYAGDATSSFQGHFSTGVPTRQRIALKSGVRGAGRGDEPVQYYVDHTDIGAPIHARRGDLADAQQHSIEMALDAAGVRFGSHLLVYPAAGASLPVAAVQRGASVDCVCLDAPTESDLRERLILAGVDDAVRLISQGGGQRGTGSGVRGSYDAIVSMEYLETEPTKDKIRFLRELGALLAPGGRISLQTIVSTEELSGAARAALTSLRAYAWPGLSYVVLDELAQKVDRHTGLRVIARSSAPEHLVASLRLQRETFASHLREAAADGYDVVYRRLWNWQFALREALAQLSMIDLVQVTLQPRSRQGRR